MRIAVTADLHLTSRSANPDRYDALVNVLNDLIKNSIRHLVIAGDCFDSNSANYSDFDQVCSEARFEAMQLFILPGNHDCSIKQALFTTPNVHVIAEPAVCPVDQSGMPVLCLPYQHEKTMGEAIDLAVTHEFTAGQWIFIGHGDWADGLKRYNEAEPGVYMPLTRRDIETYQPAAAILGHIHKPFDGERVYCPGSPCALDINETGPRRYLIIETETGAVTSQTIHAGIVCFNETVTLFPGGDEWNRLTMQLNHMVNGWRLQEKDDGRIRLRLRFQGVTSDKAKLAERVHAHFSKISYYQDEGPDFSAVTVAEDDTLDRITEAAIREIKRLGYVFDQYDPDTQQIVYHALKTIYGV